MKKLSLAVTSAAAFAFLSIFAVITGANAAGTTTATVTMPAAIDPFSTNLFFGVQAPAQTKILQKFLATQGVYSGPITGNFLNLTMQGVKQFQIVNNVVPSTGYFGPLTRAKANAVALSENFQNATLAAKISSTTIAPTTISAAAPTTAAPVAPITTTAPSQSLLAYVQMQLNSMFQTVRNLSERFFNSKNKSSQSTTTTTALPSVSTSGGAGNSGGTPVSPSPTIPSVIVTIPIPPTVTPAAPVATTPSISPPATTTLALHISISGGAAQVNNFNVTIKDNAISSIIFSGAGSASTQKFTLTQGHSYTVTEATTAASANYTIGLSAGCAGVVTATAPTCTITDAYSPPASSSSAGSTSTPTSSSQSSGNTSSGSGVSQSSQSSGLSWGVYSGDTPNTLASFQSLVGSSPNIEAIFLSMGVDSFPTNFTQTVGAAGKTLLIFWEPDNGSDNVNQSAFSYNAILSGQYDANMEQFAAAAKAYGYPVILVPMDEMNGNWDPWGGTVNGNTPAQFTQVWIHIHNLFAGVSNVKFGWDPNNESVPDDDANAISAYWPGSQYVDYVGVDGFNGNGDPWQSFSQIFPSSLMNQLAAYGKPVYIFSMGSTEDSSDPAAKATWITQGLGPNGAVSTFPNLAGWVWFNENGGDSTSNWLVNSDPAALAAFQAAIP